LPNAFRKEKRRAGQTSVIETGEDKFTEERSREVPTGKRRQRARKKER